MSEGTFSTNMLDDMIKQAEWELENSIKGTHGWNLIKGRVNGYKHIQKLLYANELVHLERGNVLPNPIDNVTVTYLDQVLKMCGLQIHHDLLDRIIDVVELLEQKGGKVTLDDVTELQEEWKRGNKPKPPSHAA
jgi:hypothetical protein